MVVMLWLLCWVCGMVFGWYIRVEDEGDDEEKEDDWVEWMGSFRV